MKNAFLTWIPGLLATAALFSGCELESASKNSVSISPSSATVSQGQSVEFTASGGFDYEWSLQNEGWGRLSTRAGSRTVYTSTYSPASNSTENTQILTVTSFIAGGTSGGTNTGSLVKTREAYITHLPASGPSATLTISPTIATLNNDGDIAVFRASGGVPPYSWSVNYSARGHIQRQGDAQGIYTRDGSGNNTVLVTDRRRAVATAQITQPAAGTNGSGPFKFDLGSGETWP